MGLRAELGHHRGVHVDGVVYAVDDAGSLATSMTEDGWATTVDGNEVTATRGGRTVTISHHPARTT